MKTYVAFTALVAASLLLAPQASAFQHVEEGQLSPQHEAMVKKLVDNHNIKIPDDLRMSIAELRQKHFMKKFGVDSPKHLRQGETEDVEAPAEEQNLLKIGGCHINIWEDTRTDTYRFVYGYVQGLYHSINYPVDGCTKCEDMALPAAQLLFAMGNIADQWTDLVSENSLESQSAT